MEEEVVLKLIHQKKRGKKERKERKEIERWAKRENNGMWSNEKGIKKRKKKDNV